MKKRVAIVGGGIAGLSAAFYLEQARRLGAALEYVLFEASDRMGGVIRTHRMDGCLVEGGPEAFLTAKPWAVDLARQAGIGDQLLGSNDAQRKTYILLKGRMVPLPDGLQMMVPVKFWPSALSPLFSISTKLRMAREFLFVDVAPAPEGDESVASFIERHFGREVVERLASPLLAGVYGGGADRMSAHAVLANFVALEKKSPSLVRGMLRARGNSAKNGGNTAAPAPVFTSFKNGMTQLVDAVIAQLDAPSIRAGSAVAKIHRESSGWRVTTRAGVEERFTHVVLAAPAHVVSPLVKESSTELAELLGAIRYTSSITVGLTYDRRALAAVGTKMPPGFGFLVPQSEGKRIMACTFVHQKFDHRAPEDRALLRVFMTGGLEQSDDQILAAVERDLREIFSLATAPLSARIERWKNAMPQYEVGHLERVARIQALAGELPGLSLIGNAYHGIGIPDCVREGKNAAARIAVE